MTGVFRDGGKIDVFVEIDVLYLRMPSFRGASTFFVPGGRPQVYVAAVDALAALVGRRSVGHGGNSIPYRVTALMP